MGRIFGIDVKFLEEEDESKNLNKFKPEYITASIDTENLKMEVEGEDLIKESTSYKVGNSFKITGEAATYISGGAAVGTGILKASTLAAETTVSAGSAIASATTVAVGVGSTALKALGTSLFVLWAVVGVALGGYFTHKYCEELLDKFEKYYKENAQKIGNSYKQATNYLIYQYKLFFQKL